MWFFNIFITRLRKRSLNEQKTHEKKVNTVTEPNIKKVFVSIKSWIVQLNEGTHCYKLLARHQIQ